MLLMPPCCVMPNNVEPESVRSLIGIQVSPVEKLCSTVNPLPSMLRENTVPTKFEPP